MLRCDCPPSSFYTPVLDELREADLITSAEGIRLRDISAVVHIQSEKSPNVMARTADILKRNGLNDDSNFLKGTQPITSPT